MIMQMMAVMIISSLMITIRVMAFRNSKLPYNNWIPKQRLIKENKLRMYPEEVVDTYQLYDREKVVVDTQFQIIGARVLQKKYDIGSGSISWESEYRLFLQKPNEHKSNDEYVVKAWQTYDWCYSGYCSATEGFCDDPVKLGYDDKVGTLHYIPKVPTVVRRKHGLYKGEHNGDTTWETIDGVPVLVVDAVGCGGSYYPEGTCTLNESLFHKTPRLLETPDGKLKRQLYVFYGPSRMGKSFLASHLDSDMNCYETDGEKEVPEENLIEHNVIIVGNKHPNQLEQVQDILSRQAATRPEVEIIWVGFQPNSPVSSSSLSL